MDLPPKHPPQLIAFAMPTEDPEPAWYRAFVAQWRADGFQPHLRIPPSDFFDEVVTFAEWRTRPGNERLLLGDWAAECLPVDLEADAVSYAGMVDAAHKYRR